MLAEERRMRIRERLATDSAVTAAELATALDVAMATIRRDLAQLEREGALVRSHGGAVSRRTGAGFDLPFPIMKRANRAEKAAIAAAARELIHDGEIVFLEGSSSVLELAGHLLRRARLTVVTNAPAIVSLVQSAPGLTVMCTGGELQKDQSYYAGAWTREVLTHARFDRAVLGVSAIDPDYGVSTTRPVQAEIKRLLATAARTRIGLADHTKFGRQAFAYVGPLTDLDVVVTSSLTAPDAVEAVRAAGVEVVVAPFDGEEDPA